MNEKTILHNGDVKSVLLDCFEDDPNLQMRVGPLDEEGIEAIAEAYRNKEEVPPIEAVFDPDNKKYYRTNGNRRCRAARLAGKNSLPCKVTVGTYRDAILKAIAANQEHDRAGLRRTNADKRNAVLRLVGDKDWVRWSDSKIADYVGVATSFVARVRNEQSQITGTFAEITKNDRREGKDGVKRSLPKKHADDRLSEIEPKDDTVQQTFSEPYPGALEQEASGRLDGETIACENPFTADTRISDDVSFDVEEIERAAAKANGREVKVFAKDAEIHKLFGQLTRLLDDRKEVVGAGTLHRNCQKALSGAYDAFKEWESAS